MSGHRGTSVDNAPASTRPGSRLKASDLAPRVTVFDGDGKPHVIGQPGDHPTVVCFFRDIDCPFCNCRLHELARHHDALTRRGLNIVAVFMARPETVRAFTDSAGFPFPVLADPTGAAYRVYGVEASRWRKWKGAAARLPTALKGLRIVGWAGLNTSNRMPADFLIARDGRIIEAWYGRDAGDRVPFGHIEMFAGVQL